MQIYEFNINSFPFILTVYANRLAEATHLFSEWHRLQLGSLPEEVHAALASGGRQFDDPDLEEPLQLGHSGIGSWVPDMGWMALPPDVDAPGTHRREMRSVRVYQFTTPDPDKDFAPLVFAASLEDADSIFETWLSFRPAAQRERHILVTQELDDFAKLAPTAAALAAKGVTGVSGIVADEVTIVPPWDVLAGWSPEPRKE